MIPATVPPLSVEEVRTFHKRVVASLMTIAGLLLVIAGILLWMAMHCCNCNMSAQPQKMAAVVVNPPPPAPVVVQEQQPKPQPAVIAAVPKQTPKRTVKRKIVAVAQPLPVTPKPAAPPIVVAQAAPPAPQSAPVPVVQATPQPVQQPASPPAPAPVQTPASTPQPAPPPAPVKLPARPFVPPQQPTTVASPSLQALPEPPKIQMPPPPTPVFAGSVWSSVLTTPLERGNYTDYSHVDFGLMVARFGNVQIGPYLGFNTVKDTLGYSWNNKIQGEAGIKAVVSVPHGVITFNGAYSDEQRFGKGIASPNRSGVIGYSTGWLGFDQPTADLSKHNFLAAFPSTFQWTIGNVSPFERNNLIGYVRLDQGVVLAKVKHLSLVPTGWFQAGFDTQGNPWNNRYVYGGGLKVPLPWTKGVVSATGGYECAEQYRGAQISPSSACGPTFRIDFWFGVRRKLGGQ